jgi:iron-sulfur cluster assembly accessory protein
MQIELTSTAAEKFIESFESENLNLDDTYLRVSANQGGCSGWRWELETNTQADIQEHDLTFVSNDIKILVDNDLFEEIIGPVTIDFSTKNLVEQGFIFVRQSGQQCGCGESFTPYKKSS